MPAKDYIIDVYNVINKIPTKEICSKPATELVEKILTNVLENLSLAKGAVASFAMMTCSEWTNNIKAEVASQITKLQGKDIFKNTLCSNREKTEQIKIQEGPDFYLVSYADAIRILLMDAIILDPDTQTMLNKHCSDCDTTWREIKKKSKTHIGASYRSRLKRYKSKNKRV